MEKRTRLLVLLAFAAGCGAAVTAVPFVVPLARAQNVQRWETRCVSGSGMRNQAAIDEVTQAGNQLGAQGWEPMGISSKEGTNALVMCFKRPVR